MIKIRMHEKKTISYIPTEIFLLVGIFGPSSRPDIYVSLSIALVEIVLIK